MTDIPSPQPAPEVPQGPRTEFVLNELRSALNAILTFFGMDEDENNKEVFDKARQAYDYAKLVMRPLEPWERQSLEDFRACVGRWHEKAVAKGYDGVESMCDTAPSAGADDAVARVDGVDEYGPRLGWFRHWADVPVGTNLYTRHDPDGDAFRTAARLGMTLRFDGGVAQSATPGTPSTYEVVNKQDRAAGMRQAVSQAAAVIAAGGMSPNDSLAKLEKQAADDTKRLDWLAERLLGADWAYGEPATSVWLIQTDASINADLRASIDAAMHATGAQA